MPSELNRRALLAAAAAFVVALAVAYALSSTGQASPGTGAPGSPAEQLNVASGTTGESTLGEVEALPALVRKPKPKPEPSEEPADTASEPAAPVTASPPPVSSPPVTTAPPPSPPPTPSEPPLQFSDSG